MTQEGIVLDAYVQCSDTFLKLIWLFMHKICLDLWSWFLRFRSKCITNRMFWKRLDQKDLLQLCNILLCHGFFVERIHLSNQIIQPMLMFPSRGTKKKFQYLVLEKHIPIASTWTIWLMNSHRYEQTRKLTLSELLVQS